MKLAVGDLVARVEAPTVLYRVTSVTTPTLVRLLPFRRSGNGVYIASMCGAWAGDGSAWRKIGSADDGRAERTP